ncbi:unnamed protein product [Cylicocyclus nassatus]|uniref:Uncharacterized protein n=1 Tax=Cylicocyclus nassatus TaxID=53992 RepID=A0AA36GR72_CYLNA|nr:unnamed protein product [Cylicocyclus nassatus]
MAKSACPAITYREPTEAQDEGGDLHSKLAYRMMKALLEEPNGRIAKRSPSSSACVCAFVSLTICICFTAAGVYVFVRSGVAIQYGRDKLEKDSNYQKDFLTESAQITICHFNERRLHYEQNAESTLGDVLIFLHNLRTSLNNRSSNVILKVKDEISKNLTSAEERFQSPYANKFVALRSKLRDLARLVSDWKLEQSDITDVENTIKALVAEILKLEQHVDAQKAQLNESFNSYPSHFNTTHTLISKEVADLTTAAMMVQRKNDFAAASEFNYALVLNLIPAFQLMSAVIAIVTFMCCRTRAFTYYLLNKEGFQALITVALLFVLLAGAFIVAYTSAYVCASLTDDIATVEILRPGDEDDDTPSPKQPPVDIIRTMKSCQEGRTLFNATGKVLVSIEEAPKLDEVIAKIESTLNNSEAKIDLQDRIKDLKDGVNELFVMIRRIEDQSLNSQEKQFKKEVKETFEKLNGTLANADVQTRELYHILTPDARADLFSKISNEVSLVKANNIYYSMISEEDEKAFLSPPCKPLGNLWNAMGSSYCKFITLPAQGIWPAFVLCIIGSLFLLYGVCKAGSYLPALEDSTTDESRLKSASTHKNPPKKSVKKKHKPPKQARPPSVKAKNKTKKSVRKPKVKKAEEVPPAAAARQAKYDRTQDDEEMIPPAKPEVAKQEPAQMPKVAWDPYEPSVRQRSWKVYPGGKPEPLPAELITSIRDWKPPPVTELTAQERENKNLETQDEEELEAPLLELDLLENKEGHKKKKSKRLSVRDEGANMIIQQDVNQNLPYRAEAGTADNQ